MLNAFRRLSWQLQIFLIIALVAIVVVLGFVALQQFRAGEPSGVPETETVNVGGTAQFLPQTDQLFGILVVGHGEVVVEPDQAVVVLGIEANEETAEEAAAQTNAAAQAVIGALEKLEVARSDIKSAGLSLSPVFPPDSPEGDSPTEPPAPIGYHSSHTLRITVRDVEVTSRVLDAALAAGANTIESVVFSLADDTAVKTAALSLATLDAAAKAKAIAIALQGSVRGLISISEDFVSVPRIRGLDVRGEAAAFAQASAQASVAPGELRVQATVRANFAFE